MNNIRYINSVPGYPAPHSPYSHAVVKESGPNRGCNRRNETPVV